MSIAGAQACSYFDDDPTSPTYGVVVQFNRISENSTFYIKGVGEKDFRGNMIYAGDESRLEIEAFDYVGKVTQLREWQKNKTPLKFVLFGVQENILWYEETTIQIDEPKSFATKKRNVVKVRMEADGGEHKIWKGINLIHGSLILKGFNNGWGDSDSNNQPDGFFMLNSQNPDFTDGILTFEHDGTASQDAQVITNIVLPIAGIKITMSIELLDAFSNDNEIKIKCFDIDDTTLSQVQADITPGTRALSHKTPTSLWLIEVTIIRSGEELQGDSGAIRNPSLRTDGSSKYEAG
ncbi:MAG: hypothetical protein ABJI69_10165 [Balneola sp.]